MPLEIRISRDSDVPIREQLSAQIVLKIGTGEFRPGDALPSVRALARRLGIHHNTVVEAYRDPVLEMLVVRRASSRLVVRDRTARPTGIESGLDQVVDQAIQTAREQGYSALQLVERLRERLLETPPDHILVTSDDPGMRIILPAELKQRFDCPVQACTPSAVLADRDLLVGALLLSPPGHLPKFEPLMRAERPAIPIVYASPADHVERIRSLSKPSLIAVVSISEYFLETARGLFAPAIGDEHSLRSVLLTQGETDPLGAVDLAFCDFVAYPVIRSRRPDVSAVCHRLISPDCFDQAAQALRGG